MGLGRWTGLYLKEGERIELVAEARGKEPNQKMLSG